MLSRQAGARIIHAMQALPSRQILLEPGSLHIWRASLALPEEERGRLEDLLSAGEREQCARFVRAADRSQSAVSRGSLRAVLAMYLREDPRTLSLTRGTSGKPRLDRANPPIQFNVSHAGKLALIAVTRGGRVGIDIERIRDVPDMEAILRNFFSRQESAYIRPRKGAGRKRAFFLLWTRREAAAKALGIGLFDCFERVVLPAPEHARSGFRIALPELDPPSNQTGEWWIRDLLPAPGYAGAVCTEHRTAKPLFLRFRTADTLGDEHPAAR